MTHFDAIPFVLAQMATTPLIDLGPFQISRSIDIGTLGLGVGVLLGIWKLIRSFERWKTTVSDVLFGMRDPDGRMITSGLVEDMRMIAADITSIKGDCPIFHQHRRAEDEHPFGHVRRQDRREREHD